MSGDRHTRRRAPARRGGLLRPAMICGLGIAVGLVAAAATGAFSSSPSRVASAAPNASATVTVLARTTAARTTETVPRLPPITPARPGTAEVISRGPTQGRKVALTFDDGFCPACVARLVRVLERTGAHATFFPNGRYEDAWGPQAKRIRRLIALGQLVVGNHTFSHGDAKTQSPDAFGADLERNERWIQRTFHVSGRPWVRPPYGSYNDGTLGAAGALGYTKVILWSGTVADSSPQTVPYLLNAVQYWAKPGVIMLMHGNYPNTAKALPRILRILQRKRLQPVTIAELLRG